MVLVRLGGLYRAAWAMLLSIACIALSGVLVINPLSFASAADDAPTMTFIDSTGSSVQLQVSSKSIYLCPASGTCQVAIQARFLGRASVGAEWLELRTANGVRVAKPKPLDVPPGAWGTIVFEVLRPELVQEVTIARYGKDYLWVGKPKISRILNVDTPTYPFDLSQQLPYGLNPVFLRPNYLGRYEFLQMAFPRVVESAQDCIEFPIAFRMLDPLTGHSHSFTHPQVVSSSVAVLRGENVVESWTEVLTTELLSLTESIKIRQVTLCDVPKGINQSATFTISVSSTLKDVGGVAEEAVSSSSTFIVRGVLEQKQLNCLKGSIVKVIRGLQPVCPRGFSPTPRKVVNGKLTEISIICVKGKQVRRVSALFPKCAAGWTTQGSQK